MILRGPERRSRERLLWQPTVLLKAELGDASEVSRLGYAGWHWECLSRNWPPTRRSTSWVRRTTSSGKAGKLWPGVGRRATSRARS